MSDPVQELNNFLQQVQKPTNLTQFLQYRNEQVGPNNQAVHHGTYLFRGVVVGTGAGTAIGLAKRAAATQALQYFQTHEIPA
ncbi:hypothetical protein EI94DRAFT_1797546 [Lactarius quietus]|nr:hypothetical protein EI94DRAFT_1797546 [Lactarius quietus]